MSNKENIKSKIEKLLSLSMSDNEHEAKLALDRALKLMGEHNITEEEVHRQQMISHTVTLNCYRTSDWMVNLYGSMSRLSGCVFTWRNGYKGRWNDKRAVARITGRERDVENATYLCEFLYRELEKASKTYKKEQGAFCSGKQLSSMVKSFKRGFIHRVYHRMQEQQRDFFNEQEAGTNLICIDTETRRNEAKDFFNEEFGGATVSKSQARYDKQALDDGITTADELEINHAVAGQKNIMKIGA